MHSHLGKSARTSERVADFGDSARLFTIEQANASLPLVRSITADLVGRTREFVERKERLEGLLAGRRLAPGDPYDEELAQVCTELEQEAQRIEEYQTELRDLGVLPQGPFDGLVDFPSLRDGRIVFLCWKFGESEVTHWHETDAGFAGRRPLETASAVGGESSRSADTIQP